MRSLDNHFWGFKERYGCLSYGHHEEGSLEKTVLFGETGKEDQKVLCLGDQHKQKQNEDREEKFGLVRIWGRFEGGRWGWVGWGAEVG